MKNKWEIVTVNNDSSNQTDVTGRLKVFGGWIVRSCNLIYFDDDFNNVISESSVFVPDANHEWELSNED